MASLTASQRRFAQAVSRLTFANPFLPERIELERIALGSDFAGDDLVWNVTPGRHSARPNIARLAVRVREFTGDVSTLDLQSEPDLKLARDVALYAAFAMHLQEHDALNDPWRVASRFRDFERDHRALATRYRSVVDPNDALADPAHTFAVGQQVRRAFENIFQRIAGASIAAAALRAAVWQSLFTHDLRRYASSPLTARMTDFTTLITGPTGSGKEVVARALAMSQFVAFDAKRSAFAVDASDWANDGSFLPVHLAALSPLLIESELFGHRRGSFTGAVVDRVGFLEACPQHGVVFLDEIGEAEPSVQVKLLRVAQARSFQRTGETRTRRFAGKLVAATNRDLAAELAAGRFREDFYYRLCGDQVVTPSLAEQVRGNSAELARLVRFVSGAVMPTDRAAGELADETVAWIARELGSDYGWPGNFRELEQCVRNVLIRGTYTPARSQSQDETGDAFSQCAWTADEMLDRYCHAAYLKHGSYDSAARRLRIDRRTVRSRALRAAAIRSPMSLEPRSTD